jgi:uncharacterized protein
VQFKNFKNILAIQTDSGKIVGFHAHNLDVAHLSESLWTNLVNSAEVSESEEHSELEAWNQEVDLATQDTDIPQAVRSLMVNIAQVCNLKCTYCAAGGDGTFGDAIKHVDIESIFEQVRMVLHGIPNGGEFSLTFFGGEPLVATDTIRQLSRFVKLQTAGREIRVRYCLITNATLVTRDTAELLASLECHVTVSLDGSPQVNDRSRKTPSGRGSSIMTLRGIELLKSVRTRLGSLTVGSVFGKHHTDVLETYKYLRDFDFDAYKFDFAAEENDGDASSEYAKALAATADFAYAQGGEAELRKIAVFDSFFEALDQKRRLHNHCGAGKSMLTIDGRGKVTTCQWFVGNPKEEIGEGADRLAAFAPRLNELNNCQSCWARHLCGGGCMFVNQLKNGSKHKKDAEFCSRTRNTIAKAIEYYAEARYQFSQGDPSETH